MKLNKKIMILLVVVGIIVYWWYQTPRSKTVSMSLRIKFSHINPIGTIEVKDSNGVLIDRLATNGTEITTARIYTSGDVINVYVTGSPDYKNLKIPRIVSLPPNYDLPQLFTFHLHTGNWYSIQGEDWYFE